MVEQRKEALRCSLLEEIAKIEVSVAALGAPGSMEERARIARYGKLLFICQHLLKVLPGLSDNDRTGSCCRTSARRPGAIADPARTPHRGLRRAGRI